MCDGYLPVSRRDPAHALPPSLRPRFPSRRLSGWTNHISSMTPQMSSNTSCLERLPSISLSLSSYLPTTASTLEWCTWRRFFAFSSVSSLRWVRRSTTPLRRGENEVVDLSRLGVEAAADDALDQHLVGDVEEEEGVGLDALLGDGVRLRGAARVPVEEPALLLRRGCRGRPPPWTPRTSRGRGRRGPCTPWPRGRRGCPP